MKSFPSLHAKVLLVDGNRDGLLVRRSLMEEQGYLVAMAVSGEEGLRLFLASHFDVVVTDYGIPSMGGVELIRRIREVKPLARVVLLSRFVEALGLTEERTGADAVIAKNSNEPANLVRCVRRLVNRPTTRKPAASQSRSAVARARA